MKKEEFPEFDVVERLFAPMPKFWKAIFNVAVVITVICAAIIGTHDQLVELGISIPSWYAKLALVASSVSAFLAKLTVDKDKWAGQR